MVPKLVAEDIPLLFSLLNDVFPQVSYSRAEMSGKRTLVTLTFFYCKNRIILFLTIVIFYR